MHGESAGAKILAARHVQAPDRHNALSASAFVLTRLGLRQAKDLSRGDRVVARDLGALPLLGKTKHHTLTEMIRIEAGALGPGRPLRTLDLPATQEILLRDWRARSLFGAEVALVPLLRLVDGGSLIALGPQPTELHEMHFAAAHILYVDGLELAASTDRSYASELPKGVWKMDC